MKTPLALYIHWPFCRSKCPYCDFNSHVREQVDQSAWRDALLAEMRHMKTQTGERSLRSIFFGGGTPSLMPADTVRALIDEARTLWHVDDGIEITLEANPTSVEAATFPAFAKAGINRVSLGVQSLNDAELAFLGREHSAKEALKAVQYAAEHFARYSFDLIYARPNQTLATWEAELAQALPYMRNHLSLYQLTIEQNTAFHHAYAKGQFSLPDEDTSTALYELTGSMLKDHGMFAYEVSNYAAPGEESRHNMAYWQGLDYVGIGPGAHGRLTLQNGARTRIASQTLKSPERWLSQTQSKGHGLENWESLSPKDEVSERIIMGLRMAQGLNLTDIHKQHGINLTPFLHRDKIAFYVQHALLEYDGQTLRTTAKGRMLLNQLSSEILLD